MKAPATSPPAREKPVAGAAACLTPGQIADRLHDVSQNFSAARMLLTVAQDRLPQEAADVRQLLKEVDDLLARSGAEFVALTKELGAAPEKDSAAKSPPQPSTPAVGIKRP